MEDHPFAFTKGLPFTGCVLRFREIFINFGMLALTKKIPKISGLEFFVYLAPSFSNRPSPHSRSSDDSHPEQIWETTETNSGRYYKQHYQQIKWCKDFIYQQFYQPKLKQCHYPNPGKKSFQKWWRLHPFLHPEKKKKKQLANCMIPIPTLTLVQASSTACCKGGLHGYRSAMTSTIRWKLFLLKWLSLCRSGICFQKKRCGFLHS